MKKLFTIILVIIPIISCIACLSGCYNKNSRIGNYTFTHCHYSDGVEGQCVTVKSWHNNKIGCEIHTPTGNIYLSEGTYQLYESNKICPYCGE
jgi:hypothetical protein